MDVETDVTEMSLRLSDPDAMDVDNFILNRSSASFSQSANTSQVDRAIAFWGIIDDNDNTPPQSQLPSSANYDSDLRTRNHRTETSLSDQLRQINSIFPTNSTPPALVIPTLPVPVTPVPLPAPGLSDQLMRRHFELWQEEYFNLTVQFVSNDRTSRDHQNLGGPSPPPAFFEEDDLTLSIGLTIFAPLPADTLGSVHVGFMVILELLEGGSVTSTRILEDHSYAVGAAQAWKRNVQDGKLPRGIYENFKLSLKAGIHLVGGRMERSRYHSHQNSHYRVSHKIFVSMLTPTLSRFQYPGIITCTDLNYEMLPSVAPAIKRPRPIRMLCLQSPEKRRKLEEERQNKNKDIDLNRRATRSMRQGVSTVERHIPRSWSEDLIQELRGGDESEEEEREDELGANERRRESFNESEYPCCVRARLETLTYSSAAMTRIPVQFNIGFYEAPFDVYIHLSFIKRIYVRKSTRPATEKKAISNEYLKEEQVISSRWTWIDGLTKRRNRLKDITLAASLTFLPGRDDGIWKHGHTTEVSAPHDTQPSMDLLTSSWYSPLYQRGLIAEDYTDYQWDVSTRFSIAFQVGFSKVPLGQFFGSIKRWNPDMTIPESCQWTEISKPMISRINGASLTNPLSAIPPSRSIPSYPQRPPFPGYMPPIERQEVVIKSVHEPLLVALEHTSLSRPNDDPFHRLRGWNFDTWREPPPPYVKESSNPLEMDAPIAIPTSSNLPIMGEE